VKGRKSPAGRNQPVAHDPGCDRNRKNGVCVVLHTSKFVIRFCLLPSL